eukprot:2555885-Amphidinium_carterae.1
MLRRGCVSTLMTSKEDARPEPSRRGKASCTLSKPSRQVRIEANLTEEAILSKGWEGEGSKQISCLDTSQRDVAGSRCTRLTSKKMSRGRLVPTNGLQTCGFVDVGGCGIMSKVLVVTKLCPLLCVVKGMVVVSSFWCKFSFTKFGGYEVEGKDRRHQKQMHR